MKLPFSKPSLPDAATVRAEFVAVVARLAPDERVVESGDDWIKFQKQSGGEHRVSLGKVFERIERTSATSPKARATIYSEFIGVIWSHETPSSFGLDEFRERIFPTPRRRGFLAEVRRGLGQNTSVPHRDLGEELVITYIIDFPKTVAHITDKQALELGLDEAALWELALGNAQGLLPREQFRVLFESGQVVSDVPCDDGLAAPRLIAAMSYLDEGEEAAALVFDGAKFLLVQTPPTNNWNTLRSAAKNNANSTGWDRPLRLRKGELVLM